MCIRDRNTWLLSARESARKILLSTRFPSPSTPSDDLPDIFARTPAFFAITAPCERSDYAGLISQGTVRRGAREYVSGRLLEETLQPYAPSNSLSVSYTHLTLPTGALV